MLFCSYVCVPVHTALPLGLNVRTFVCMCVCAHRSALGSIVRSFRLFGFNSIFHSISGRDCRSTFTTSYSLCSIVYVQIHVVACVCSFRSLVCVCLLCFVFLELLWRRTKLTNSQETQNAVVKFEVATRFAWTGGTFMMSTNWNQTIFAQIQFFHLFPALDDRHFQQFFAFTNFVVTAGLMATIEFFLLSILLLFV